MEPDGASARPVVDANASSEQAIEALGDLDHAALKGRWRALRGGNPPTGLSRPLLVRALAHAMQEKAFGGLPPALRRRLERLGTELRATGRIATTGRQPKFKPGTRLIREWQRRTHEVTILENGFHWNGQTYRSLSAIARAITGTRWNGHVFFGLKPRQAAGATLTTAGDQNAAGVRQGRTCRATDQQEGRHG